MGISTSSSGSKPVSASSTTASSSSSSSAIATPATATASTTASASSSSSSSAVIQCDSDLYPCDCSDHRSIRLSALPSSSSSLDILCSFHRYRHFIEFQSIARGRCQRCKESVDGIKLSPCQLSAYQCPSYDKKIECDSCHSQALTYSCPTLCNGCAREKKECMWCQRPIRS